MRREGLPNPSQLPPIHLLDATLAEEASIPLRLHLMFSFIPSATPTLQSMRLSGPAELDMKDLKDSLAVGVEHAVRRDLTDHWHIGR